MFCTLSRVLYICSSKYLEWFQLTEQYMVEMAMFNLQRVITSKVGKLELQLMYSAHCLIVLHICVKFGENILNRFELTERIWIQGRNGYVQCSKGNNSKSRQIRVKVHVFCMSSLSALHLCKVLWKYLWWYQSYGADTNDGSDAGQMDKIPLCVEN